MITTFSKTRLLAAWLGVVAIITACAPVSNFAPTPTLTLTPFPTKTPTIITNLELKDFSFPVAFEGPYSIGHHLVYCPCHHWDPSKYDPAIITSTNWQIFFHAGDLFELNLSPTVEIIVVLSPITGTIERVTEIPDNGIEINLRTDYFVDGKRVYVDVVHSTILFPGDEQYPEVTIGSLVLQGQPLSIQKIVFQWGRPEQAVDIGIRNGPRGANPSIPGNFYPESYLDPYDYLIDEIPELLGKHLTYDTGFRAHCLLSGHYP